MIIDMSYIIVLCHHDDTHDDNDHHDDNDISMMTMTSACRADHDHHDDFFSLPTRCERTGERAKGRLSYKQDNDNRYFVVRQVWRKDEARGWSCHMYEGSMEAV